MLASPSVGTPSLWAGFLLLIGVLLALDLGLFHRKEHSVSLREAAFNSAVWIGLALLFNVYVWQHLGSQAGLEFLTGYLVEKALSVDNIFVFVVLFRYFVVPRKLQHSVLFFGILGALVMRGIFIAAGAALLDRFHIIIYIFPRRTGCFSSSEEYFQQASIILEDGSSFAKAESFWQRHCFLF